jgi:hypothetical protein
MLGSCIAELILPILHLFIALLLHFLARCGELPL